MQETFRAPFELVALIQPSEPVDGRASAPRIRWRGNPLAFPAAKEVGREIEEGAILVAHLGAGVGPEEACGDDGIVTRIEVNYLPVGSQQAAEFYAECALEARVAFVNCIPVFIGSDATWAKRFEQAGVPVIGDDIKSQLGATIVHRVLTHLFKQRGVKLERTYQLNTGGNTDFLNMLERARLASKKVSKTEAVQSVAEHRLDWEDIHVGPSDYVAWQNDNKVCFLRMEGQLFGGVPMNLELRLSVEDSPNSAGVAIDLIRCARVAMDRGLSGPIHAAASAFCKHPPRQVPDDEALAHLERFIEGRP